MVMYMKHDCFLDKASYKYNAPHVYSLLRDAIFVYIYKYRVPEGRWKVIHLKNY